MTPAVRVLVDTPHIGQISVGFELCPRPKCRASAEVFCFSWGAVGRPGPAYSEQGSNGAGTCIQDGIWHGHCC